MRDTATGSTVAIATIGGTGAAFTSCVAGGDVVAAMVVIEQQQLARIVEVGGASCFVRFDGQQQVCRTFPSMLQR